ncbi:hypothetical protein ABPG72_005702, partial [Tetrahymena utriculariae]
TYQILTFVTSLSIRGSQNNENADQKPNKKIERILQTCGQNCKCTDPSVSICSSCIKSYYYYFPDLKKCDFQSVCSGVSKTVYYEQNICCPNYCKECSKNKDDYNCSQCQVGYFLTLPNTCTQCDSSCISCSGSAKKCITCARGLYQFTDLRFFLDLKKTCQPCHSTCSTCNGQTEFDCLSCEQEKYIFPNHSCKICQTDNKYYIDQNLICQECHSSCLTCSGNSDSNCLSCPDDNQNSCVKCHETCTKCNSNMENDCTECKQGLSFQQDNTCQVCDTKNRKFVDPNNRCQLCHSSCQTCSNSQPNSCFSCQSPRQLFNGICNICHSSCLQCKGESDQDCLKCQPGLYFLPNGKCGICPDVGFYRFEGKCIQCDSSCSSCNGSTKYDCISCSYPYSYFDQSHQCQRCHIDCESCFGSNKNECLKCLNKNLYISLKNQNCEKCQDNQFNDGIKCIKCSDHCQICTSSNTCEKCEKGYYYKDNQCSQCDQNCLSCSGHLKCDACVLNFKLYDGLCFNCKEDEYLDLDTKQCEPCHSKCKSCFGKTDASCIKCSNALEFFDEDNYCVDKCKESYIRSPITDRCQKCFYFQTDKNKLQCVLDCPSGYFVDNANICQKCGPYCLKCKDKDTCLQCQVGLSLMSHFQKVCVKCKADEFVNENNICQKCLIQNCETCQSKTVCLTCAKTYQNKLYYCEYDKRYDNYSCLHDKAEQCEKELELIAKVDISIQSIQISSIALQSVSALLFQTSGSFLYSIQMQQIVGNIKLTGDLKVVSLGFTFLEQSYQMNFINLIPSPLNLETQNDSQTSNSQNKLNSKRSLSESDVSSNNIKLLRSQNLSKIFLNNIIIYVIIIGITIAILAICKLLKSKFKICETIDSKNRSYIIRLQLIFSNFILISIFYSIKNAQFSTEVQVISFVFSIIYLMCYILFLVFFYLKVSTFKKLVDMDQVNQYYIFVENLNFENPFQKYFWLFFEIKKILNLLFISFISVPGISLSLILLLNLLFLTYMIKYKPVLVLHELRYYYTLEIIQILINVFVLLTALYKKEQLAWSAIAFMGIMFVINVLYTIFQIYKTIKIKWFKERFIVSKTTFYEEELRQSKIDNTLSKSKLKIKILKSQQTARQDEFTNSSKINDSRTIEYLDNIHQLSIKWNKNPIFTRQTLFNHNFKL